MKTKEHTPQERFERGSTFVLSKALVGDRDEFLSRTLNRKLCWRTASVDGYNLEVVTVPGRIAGVSSRTLLFGSDGPLGGLSSCSCYEARLNGRLLPLVTTTAAFAHIDADLIIGTEEKMREARDHKRIAELYLPILQELARLSGWKIMLHLNAATTLSPFPDDATLHLVAGSTPPGQQGTQWVKAAFGGRIDKEYEWVNCREPTRGRGIVICDEDETSLVQLIGRTAYILFPIIGKFHGKESLAIFAKMLRALWNRLQREPNAWARDHTSKAQGKSAFVSALTVQAEATPKHWEKRLEKLRGEIADAEERLRLLHMNFNEQTSIAIAARTGKLFQHTVDRLPKDYVRIKKHPSVACVYVRDGGVHIETALIVGRYKGNSYALGRYVIRLGESGEVSVWGLESQHPRGVPHPHLPLSGTPCFGTASSAIMQASAEFRFADCAEYVLAWLKEGYTPEGATAKIEEWPIHSTTKRES